MGTKVKTEYGIGIIDDISINEHGFLRVKVFYEDKKQWITFTERDGVRDIINKFNFKLV